LNFGTITYYSHDSAAQVRAKNLAEIVDAPDGIYRRSVQIAELNAWSACLAVVCYKQLRGFYLVDDAPYHLLMGVESLRAFPETVL
jgi:hypothetical protein